MNLRELEHVLRACGSITGCREIALGMLRAAIVTEAAIRSLASELSADQGVLLGVKLQVCLRQP
jgi:hypothetical protein